MLDGHAKTLLYPYYITSILKCRDFMLKFKLIFQSEMLHNALKNMVDSPLPRVVDLVIIVPTIFG